MNGGEQTVEYDLAAKTQYQQLLRKGSKKLRNHCCSNLGAINLQRLPHIPQGGSWRDIPRTVPKGMQRARDLTIQRDMVARQKWIGEHNPNQMRSSLGGIYTPNPRQSD